MRSRTQNELDDSEREEAADELHPAIPWVELERVRQFGSGTPGTLVGVYGEDEWLTRQIWIDQTRENYAID